ncbi:MAG: hypothetical protein M3010_11510 [Candidatus Dormibacteraeota bacterium]|nr:hypothetical protein [Candidatus Dormibacteraeota bacterium]
MRRTAMMLSVAGLSLAAIFVQSAPAVAKSSGGTTTAVAAYDVSYPQCGVRLPSGGSTAVVGVTNGLPWSSNPCLASEYGWAAAKPQPAQLYMNTANPETASSNWTARAGTGPRACSTADLSDPANPGCAYNYGWNSARDALSRATAAVGAAGATHVWWLDVETGNSWNGSVAANAQDLQGSVDYLRSAGVPGVGFYSTSYQWGVITGGWQAPAGTTGAPANWIAGAGSASQAKSWCSPSYSFSGGAVRLVQYPSGSFDGDYLC